MTYSQIILKVLEDAKGWVMGNSLANWDTKYGFLPERACRTARQMAAKGLIERKEDYKNGKRIVFYRIKPKIIYEPISVNYNTVRLVQKLSF